MCFTCTTRSCLKGFLHLNLGAQYSRIHYLSWAWLISNVISHWPGYLGACNIQNISLSMVTLIQRMKLHRVYQSNHLNEPLDCSNFFSERCQCQNMYYSKEMLVFIHFLQAKFDHDMPCETVSKINLVDLAGRYMFIVVFSFFHYLAVGF